MSDGGIERATASEGQWMVQAVIQPFKLDQVVRALETVEGFSGMTVGPVRGFGQEKLTDRTHGNPAHKAQDLVDDFTRKDRIEVVVTGRRIADAVTAAIARVAHTGNRGDGKIFMWPLSRVVRIRTMEEDNDAV